MSDRKRIRKSIEDGLKGLGSWGQNVFSYRMTAFDMDELPAINIIPVTVTTERENQAYRKITFAICGITRNDGADCVEDMESEILKAMKCIKADCRLARFITTDIGLSDAGQTSMASVRCIFEFEYIPADVRYGY